MEWKRDWGLTARVWLTGLLLLLLYLVFMTVLFAFGVGLWFIVLLAVGMGLVQYFFSDKLVLWSTGARIIADDEYPDLHRIVEKLCHDSRASHAKDRHHAKPGTECVCHREEPETCSRCLHGFDHASPEPGRTGGSARPRVLACEEP